MRTNAPRRRRDRHDLEDFRELLSAPVGLTAGQVRDAALVICGSARDAADAALLLDTCGITR